MIDPVAVLFLVPGVFLGAYAAIYLKKGSKHFSLNPFKILQSRELVFGLSLYILSVAFYLVSLSRSSLSVIYPLSSFSYVAVSILSVKYLNEKMTFLKWLGVIFIIAGSFFMV